MFRPDTNLVSEQELVCCDPDICYKLNKKMIAGGDQRPLEQQKEARDDTREFAATFALS